MNTCPQCGYKPSTHEDQNAPLTVCPQCGTSYEQSAVPERKINTEGAQKEVRPLSSFPPNAIYVGFWQRLVATCLDSLLLFAAAAFVAGLMTMAQPLSPSPHEPFGNFLLTFVFPAVVTLLFWFRFFATPGKMLFSAIIVDANTGAVPTRAQYVGRYLGYALSGIALGLGFLWVAIDPRKQGWHDKLAGTVVVQKQGTLFPTRK